MEKVELSPAVSVPWRQYKISNDINVIILTGSNTGSSGTAAKLTGDKKKLVSCCVAALSYSRIHSERSWKPDDIDKIVDIGWNINRRTMMKRPMNIEHQREQRDVTDVFYIDSIKFVTLTKSIAAGTVYRDNSDSVNVFFKSLHENGQQSCIVEFGMHHFALWKSDDKYFVFQPLSFYHKSPKCIQFSSFEYVQKYLNEMFVESQLEYVFHSVDILKLNNYVLSRDEIWSNCNEGLIGESSANDTYFVESTHRVCLMPHTLQSSYESVSESVAVLRCPKSTDRSAKIPSTCVAAIVVLRAEKASFWTSETLSDVLALGSKVYKENLKSLPKGQTVVRVADVASKIEFRSIQCLIESQQILFGKVESRVANLCDMEQGLNQFFLVHLAGIIDGPNVVAIWKEENYYYMYDAKARNRFGRKLSKAEVSIEGGGKSCVTRFEQVKDLADTYVENISQKERQEYYKITNIELKPFLGKNWYEWQVTLPGQWCLRGQESFKTKDCLRSSVIALLCAEDLTMKNWKPNTIDEIFTTSHQCSDDHNLEGHSKEIKMEVFYKDRTSYVSIKPKIFSYVVNELDRNIENDLVKETGNKKKEILCASRFGNPVDVVKSLTANIIIRKNQEFSLRSVNLSQDEPKYFLKKMKNYKTLEVANGCAGILPIPKSFNLVGREENSILRNIYHVTSVVAMTVIKDCWSWSNYDVCDILKISQKIFPESFKGLENFSIKIGNTTIKIQEMETFSGANERGIQSKSKSTIEDDSASANKSETENGLSMDVKPIIEIFLNTFEEQEYPNAILTTEFVQLGLWKQDGVFFMFDSRDADETGVAKKLEAGNSKRFFPYVAWFDSLNGLLDHIWTNLLETESGAYEFFTFKLKAKTHKSNRTTWYNFTPINDTSNQWVIRSLYGSLHPQYAITSCVIALAFASTLQPPDWNSSMLDSVLKYGMKLYKKSLKASQPTEIKLNAIATPFIIGCSEFSFTEALFKCGANEQNALENGIENLFNHSIFGVVSSKGYSAAIWQQNNSYFIFDPQLNGMASLSRFSKISCLSCHFLCHVRTGMTGVNVFEMFKISVSRNVFQKKYCAVDVEAISKLTNRISETIINTPQTFNHLFSDVGWSELQSIPTECLLFATCVFGCHKNPQFWTCHTIDEILSLGKSIFQTAVVGAPNEASKESHEINGVYAFDGKTAVHIRMELFKAGGDRGSKVDLSVRNNDYLKSTLTEFFQRSDNAFLSTEEAKIIAWKQGHRFYLFHSHPVNIDGRLVKTGEPKGTLMSFKNADELCTFLKICFGDCSDLQNFLKIQFVEIDFVPLQNVNGQKKGGSLVNNCSSRLNGRLCQCSSNEAEHVEKHFAMSVAAILMSKIQDIMSWTEKTLLQVEVMGKTLYDDVVISECSNKVTIDLLPHCLYIEHVEYHLIISDSKTYHTLDEQTLTKTITDQFDVSSSLYVLIDTFSFSLMKKDAIFYWYDPNGVDDENKEIRPSVCCFSDMKLLTSHIIGLGGLLQSTTFEVEFISIRKF